MPIVSWKNIRKMFTYIYIMLSLLGFILGGRLAGSSAGPNLGQSVFDYIEKQNARSPLFYNFMYTPDTDHPVRFFLLLYNLYQGNSTF
jgi:hypothetical protein